MVKEEYNMQMEIYYKDILIMDNLLRQLLSIIMEIYTQEKCLKISSMDKDNL
jgi:hypothetical protein